MSFSRDSVIRQEQPSARVKVVFVGDSGAGKTSLLNRQCSDTFTKEHLATIGVDFKIKSYDLGVMKINAQLWDTAGQERFRSIQKPYYKGASAVCLCFSLNDPKSFQNLPKWIQEMSDFDVSRENVFLIGCKSDLDMEVPTDQILVFAAENNLQFFQTSSKQGDGVNDAFRSIMITCAQKQIKRSAENIPMPVQQKQKGGLILNEDPKVKKGCC